MKKFIKIFLSVLLIFILIIALVPLLFKSQIVEKVKQEVNKNILAKVDWDDFSVSLLTGFPDLKVKMKNLSVVGINKFEGDTLIAMKDFAIKLDLMKVLRGDIVVKSILLNKAILNIITLPDSSVNYDIMIPSDTSEEEVSNDTTSAMVMKLKKFEIKNSRINYIDKLYNMSAFLNGFDGTLTGDFSADYTKLKITSTTKAFSFIMDKMTYINKATLDFNSIIEADLVKYNFTFSENQTTLNDLKLGFEGSFGLPNDTDITIDLRFFAKESEFKSILSLIPAVYMKDFSGVKTEGKFSLEGSAKGIYNEKEMPKIDLIMKINDGNFSYPDLPKSVNNINVDLKVFYDGVQPDNTLVDLNKFHMEMAGNPFDMQLHIKTPMSDMQLNGTLKGKIDIASITDVIPLEGTQLTGNINTDLFFMGKMSDIEKENYENFQANGFLEVNNVIIKGKDIPLPVSISRVSMNFTPQFVKLTAFDALIGKSDIHMNGTLGNFIPYVFNNGIIKGQLNLSSTLLDISELMPDSDSAEVAETQDTTALSVIQVPKNIDFLLQSDIKTILYDKLTITNVLGRITVKEGKIIMDNLSMNLLEGFMVMSGEYNSLDITAPLVNYKLDMKGIDIPSSFTAFNTVEKLAPIAALMKGTVSVNMDFNSVLNSDMSPVLESIMGSGFITTDEVEVANSETFNKISQALKNDKLKNIKISDVKAFFEIKNGRIILKPFDTKISSYTVNIGGDQGLDQTLNYAMIFKIPRSEFGSAANDLIEDLTNQAASKGLNIKQNENVNIKVKITGTFKDPKIGLDLNDNMAKVSTDIKEAIKEKVFDQVQKGKEDIKEMGNVEVDKILKEAEEQAANIKAQAKEGGERLIGEAELQGKNLIKEAGSNPLKKALAEKTASGMVKQATQKADALNKEAETKANAIMAEAQKRADALKK